MQIFKAGAVFDALRALTIWSRNNHGDDPMNEERRKDQHTRVLSFHKPLVDIGFAASAASITKLVTLLDGEACKWNSLKEPAKECVGRLIDEAHAAQFFSLTPREADLFKNPKNGWESSVERFPSIVDDVEEASKCYALSRYSAAVFHSVQIIEAGLIELGKFLKVVDPHSGWTAVAQALKKVIEKKHQDRTKFEKANFKFLEQVQGTVDGLKNAWRNKISHSQGRLILMTAEFSPEVAEEILMATRAFMRRLAEDLPKSKKRAA